MNMDQEGADVNNRWENFKMAVTSAVKTHIPSTLCWRNTDLPRIGQYIKKLLRRNKRLFKQAQKNSNLRNYRYFKKDCRREIRKAEHQHVNRVIEKGRKRNNTKPFWRYMKARCQDNTWVTPPEERHCSLQ